MILAIDIGGTSSKFGLVSGNGEISGDKKFETEKAVGRFGLAGFLENEIRAYIREFPRIEGIGMGLPGLLSRERKEILELPNIPEVGRLPVVAALSEKFPGLPLKIENDAKCATLGEYHFGKHAGMDDFLLVTIGTGIGSGVIIGGKLFLGARGNGMELGHILTGGEKTLEEQIGSSGFLNYAREQAGSRETILQRDGFSAKDIFDAAEKGDALAVSLFGYMGRLLGEALVAAVRLLDVTTLLLGGGVSGAFDYILPELEKALGDHLPAYYTASLKIEKASLGNNAGLLGAASLFMK
ncbi:MAG TPA: ROK family protein [Anseongella sp.]|nr:ROK family protein [Anseongella sp.]